MFAPPICKRRWRNNAFPFRQLRRRRRQPSEHRSERQRAIKYSAMREQLQNAPRYSRVLVVGVAGKKLSEHLTERCSRVQLREDSQTTQPDTMDQQIAGWQVQLHCYAT
jgi:hypothetical protein